MTTFSYPKPANPLPHIDIETTSLHPLSVPRALSDGPSLPEEAVSRAQREGVANIIPGYKFSTHLFKASSPRTKCNIGPTPTFPMALPNRKERIQATAAHLASIRSRDEKHIYEEGWPAPENELWMVVNRLVSSRIGTKEASGRKGVYGITMTFMHANGFHKETWEETLRAIIRQYPNFNETVDEIWLFDSVNEGDSALVNEGKLGDIFNWHDNARDLLAFLLYYLPETAGSPVSLHLEPLSESIAKQRRQMGFAHRNLIGAGHSFGGASTVRAAIEFPKLFSDVILVDPVIHSAYLFDAIWEKALPLHATVGRRVEFPNRDVAHEIFSKIPFFSKWDPRVLKSYVNYAMTEDKVNGGVRLKTYGFQEAAVFAECKMPSEVYQLLPTMDPRIELRWIMSGKDLLVSEPGDNTPDSVWRRDMTVWRREENASNMRMHGAGHLVTQMVPDDLGIEIGSYVLNKYSPKHKETARL